MQRNPLASEISALIAPNTFQRRESELSDLPLTEPLLQTVSAIGQGALMSLWFRSNAATKKFHPQEPPYNIDQFTIPPWLSRSLILGKFRKDFGAEADMLIGVTDQPVTAQYFVIHDTAGTNDVPTLKRVPSRAKGIHCWIGINSALLARDWAQDGLGTKLERGKFNRCFVHTELTRHPKGEVEIAGVKAAGTFYTFRQYNLLAYAYLVCSLRKGRFLTVTIHREVDRAVRVKKNDGTYSYGHNDPQKFDMDYFYQLVRGLLGMPNLATFGIQPQRVSFMKEKNQGGFANTFLSYGAGKSESANQYGEPEKNPKGQDSHHTPGKFRRKCEPFKALNLDKEFASL